jgi:hypothetical protein
MTVGATSSSSASAAMDFSAMSAKSSKAAAPSSGSKTAAASSSSDENVSSLSDAELKKLAAEGDSSATQELQKREAERTAKEQSAGREHQPKTEAHSEQKGISGNRIDAYA